MSDNEDLLGEDLGDHSLADYNLGNEEEEQLLADDYDTGVPQNVPSSHGPAYREPVSVVPNEFPSQAMEYSQPAHTAEAECVVPNITVEVPNVSHRPHSTYAPYEPPVYDEPAVVPPPIPAAPVESPQIVPSEVPSVSNGEPGRNRFISERTGPVRTPQQRNIPDSLDKVIVPGGMPGAARGRNSWRHPQYRAPHPYRRQNFRGNFSIRNSFPPPQRPPLDPQPELRPEIPQMGPEISPERPILPQDMPLMPLENRPFNQGPPRFPYRNEEPNFQNVRPNFERPMFYQRPAFNPRFAPPVREIAPPNLPQITIHQPAGIPMMPKGREPEVRMLPVQLPPNLPPGGLAGKKVLINPHFKGNFQPPIEGPIKDIDDAAERFIAEQRNALARAAGRKYSRRSPQRYIENTTIEIENDLVRRDDDELLRRQEEFINANRAGLRRRMRSPTPPPRRSPSPRRARPPPPPHTHAPSDEDSDYRRRVREQESMRERVLRAKEVRRRKNAVALQKQLQDREKEQEKEVTTEKPRESPPKVKEEIKPTTTYEQDVKPDTTRNTPERSVKEMAKQKEIEKPKEKEVEKVRERSPVSRKVESAEANSTCDGLTPPRETLTPPLDDDDLDLILGDIDGILSEDDEPTPQKPKPKNETKPAADLRSKLAPKIIKTSTTIEKKPQQRQKIVFNDDKDKKKKEKSPIRRTFSTISKNHDDDQEKPSKTKESVTNTPPAKSRQKIIFNKQSEKETEERKQTFANRRVILQRKTNKEKIFRVEKTDPTRPHPGIFSRAVTAIVDVKNEPQVEYDSGSDDDKSPAGKKSPVAKHVALVTNLPHGMTDTRLTTLAGNEVQSLSLDKEERSAKITFKTASAAEIFRKKFNNKMVAASRLTVNLK